MKYANDYSGCGNTVLYNMCADEPAHKDIDTAAIPGLFPNL